MRQRDNIIVGSIQAAVIACLLGAWYFSTHSSKLLSLFLPPRERVWTAFRAIAASGRLWAAPKITLLTIAEAYAIAAVAGIAVGFLVARSERLLRLFEPMLSGMFAIPITMFFPLFILFFGLGPQSKIAYGATYAFFPIALNTIAGFSSVDRLFVRAIQSMGANGLQQLRHAYLPAALPGIASGLTSGVFICSASVLGRGTLASRPKIIGDQRVRAEVGVALFELATGFALSVVVGTLLGILIGLSDLGRRSFYPLVLLLYAIPQVILLPLFMLLFGIGPAGKIAFGFSHGVFPIIVNTVAGMRNVNPLLVRGTEALGASRAEVVRYVIFPHMVTALFAGLRLAMTMTLLGVILAELFVSTAGIGPFTQLFAESFAPAPLFALIGTLALMAILANELVRLVEARFTRWKE